MRISQENPPDGWEVEALFDLCFAPGRTALSSYRLRDGVPPLAPLCLVVRDDPGGDAGDGGADTGAEAGKAVGDTGAGAVIADGGGLAGGAGRADAGVGAAGPIGAAIRYWPVRVGRQPALLLGPVAVHPTRQGEGLGALLIAESLARAAALGHSRVLLVGDAPYYGRFGFARLAAVTMPPPTNPDRVLGRALSPGAWDGVAGRVRRALATPARMATFGR